MTRLTLAAALLSLCTTALGAMMQNTPEGIGRERQDKLVGNWLRTGEGGCIDAYPESLTIRAGGTYVAAVSDEEFREWQAGDFEVRGDRTVRIQMSNDRMQEYRYELSDSGVLTFTDDAGCRIEYRRG